MILLLIFLINYFIISVKCKVLTYQIQQLGCKIKIFLLETVVYKKYY